MIQLQALMPRRRDTFKMVFTERKGQTGYC
jgi:hypothetical protein